MSIPVKTDLDLNQNELLNPVAHNTSAAPSSPKAGQFAFYNSALWYYNGSAWVNTGLVLASDSEAATGTNETKAVNPKQLGLKANIASPAFTGTPTAPTASAGTNNTQIATTAYCDGAIAAATLNAKIYMGAWDTTSQTDFSGLDSYKPIKKGYFFDVTGSGCTIDGVEYKAGDAITFKSNVAVGTTITSAMIHKTDNTESDNLVRLDSTQTLTNKTIDADDNTISDLTTSNFKSGEVIGSVTQNSGKLITSGGVYSELQNYQTNLTFSTGLTNTGGTVTVDHPFIALSQNSMVYGGSGGTLQELSAGTDGYVLTSDDGVPTWKAPVSEIVKRSYTNPALTPSSGICTWNVSHNLNSKDFVAHVYEVSTGEEVLMDITATGTTSVAVQFNSASNVAAGTYCLVLVG
jgi:hypothetical protein